MVRLWAEEWDRAGGAIWSSKIGHRGALDVLSKDAGACEPSLTSNED